LEELCVLDGSKEERVIDVEEKLRNTYVIGELEKVTLMEEISRRQKSRVLWLKDGDKRTKFFHQEANSNRRDNFIESLSVNGSVSFNQSAIRDHIVHFYDSLFS